MIKKDYKMCPVTKFIAWLILGLLVCIIGITNVFADTYTYNQFTAQLYDNYAPTLSAVTTDQTNGRWQGVIPTMTANSAGAAWGVSSNMVLLANHTYTLSAQITGTYGGHLVLSTYNRIGVGTTLANAKTSYQNNSNVNENYSRVLDDGYTIQFAFTPTTNGSYIVFPFATNYSGNNQYFYLSNYTIDDLGSSGGVTESTINNSLNSQTNVLNQSITNSQNAIIQNQNENTQIINDGLNNVSEQLGTCYTNMLDMRNPTSQTATVSYSGTWIQYTGSWSNMQWDIPITKAGSYTVATDNDLYNNLNIEMYYVTPQGVRTDWLGGYGSGSNHTTITTSYNTGYIRVILYDTNNTSTSADISKLRFTDTSSVVPYSQYNISQCTSKLDDLNSNITDDNVDSSSWSNFFNNFTTNTFGLTSIITAPLNLIQSLTNTSCTDLQLPLPYLQNKYLTLPCMTTIYSQYFGTFFTLYQTITYGIIAYWVCVRIFNLVKDFKNPDHDEIEVVDL